MQNRKVMICKTRSPSHSGYIKWSKLKRVKLPYWSYHCCQLKMRRVYWQIASLYSSRYRQLVGILYTVFSLGWSVILKENISHNHMLYPKTKNANIVATCFARYSIDCSCNTRGPGLHCTMYIREGLVTDFDNVFQETKKIESLYLQTAKHAPYS